MPSRTRREWLAWAEPPCRGRRASAHLDILAAAVIDVHDLDTAVESGVIRV
ncbi:MAG: hypothetical protein ACXV3F_13010 [Frankiaceae bacterium]